MGEAIPEGVFGTLPLFDPSIAATAAGSAAGAGLDCCEVVDAIGKVLDDAPVAVGVVPAGRVCGDVGAKFKRLLGERPPKLKRGNRMRPPSRPAVQASVRCTSAWLWVLGSDDEFV